MKHWLKVDNRIILANSRYLPAERGRVLQIEREENGVIVFRERCDQWATERYSAEEAIAVLQEAIENVQKEEADA